MSKIGKLEGRWRKGYFFDDSTGRRIRWLYDTAGWGPGPFARTRRFKPPRWWSELGRAGASLLRYLTAGRTTTL